MFNCVENTLTVMAKSIKEVEFELNRVYKTYSDQIIVINDVAQLLHQNVDIKASGNQIESGLRNLLSSLLPKQDTSYTWSYS